MVALQIDSCSAEQTFFLNADVFLRAYSDGDASPPELSRPPATNYIDWSASSGATLVSRPPSVTSCLDHIYHSLVDIESRDDTLPEVISLPDHDASVLVPLAGLLLEYPIAYIPLSLSTPFLAGEELDFFDVSLVGE